MGDSWFVESPLDGRVRYEADINLNAGSSKCNCSICTKKRSWNLIIKPEAFRLLRGEAELTDYQFGSNSLHYLFCKHCGVSSFGWGNIPEIGGKLYAVNVTCLDDVDIDELVNSPITYYDGRSDNWDSTPKEIRHL